MTTIATAFFPARTRSRFAPGTPLLFPKGCASFPFAAPIPPNSVRVVRSAEPQEDGRLLVVLSTGETGYLPGEAGDLYRVPEPGGLANVKPGSRLLIVQDHEWYAGRFKAGQEVVVYRVHRKENAACKLAGEKDLPHPADRKDWVVLASDVVMLLPDDAPPEPEAKTATA